MINVDPIARSNKNARCLRQLELEPNLQLGNSRKGRDITVQRDLDDCTVNVSH